MPLQNETFDTPGADTFTVPAGVSSIVVWCFGGGGNGSGGGGEGGGGGASAKKTISVTPSTVYDLFVGDAEEDSWFDDAAVLLADGASGSTPGSAGNCVGDTAFNGGSGGGGGDVNGGGGGGCAGIASDGNPGADGDDGGLGGAGGSGAPGDGGDGGTEDVNGEAGGIGAGGGGGGAGVTSGGAGGHGRVFVEWFVPTGQAAITIAAITAAGSAAYSPGTDTGSAAITIRAVTASGTATYTLPTSTGAGAATATAATAAGSASHTRPTYTASGAATIAPVTAAGVADFNAPIYTASAAISIAPVTASGSAAFNTAIFTASAAVSIAPVTASGSAAHVRPTYTGNATVTIKAVTAAGTATHAPPVYTGAGAATIAPVTASGTAAFATSVFLATGASTIAPVTASGTATFTATTTHSGVIAVTIGPVTTSVVVFDDEFATDTSANYTAVAGSGSIAGGELTTSSSSFLFIHNTAGTSGTGLAAASGEVDTTGGAFRTVGSYVDSSNYLFAEVTINGASSTLKLWSREGGVNTQIGSTYTFSGAVNTAYDVEVSWNGSQATAALDGTTRASGSYSGTGNKAGVGATPNGGTATFGSLSFVLPSFATFSEQSGWWPWCCCDEGVDCAPCDPENMPDTVTVEISGFVSSGFEDPGCPDCSIVNGTHVLDWTIECRYFLNLGECSGFPGVHIGLVVAFVIDIGTGDRLLHVHVGFSTGAYADHFFYIKNLTDTDEPCIGEHEITVTPYGLQCNTSGGAITVIVEAP